MGVWLGENGVGCQVRKLYFFPLVRPSVPTRAQKQGWSFQQWEGSMCKCLKTIKCSQNLIAKHCYYLWDPSQTQELLLGSEGDKGLKCRDLFHCHLYSVQGFMRQRAHFHLPPCLCVMCCVQKGKPGVKSLFLHLITVRLAMHPWQLWNLSSGCCPSIPQERHPGGGVLGSLPIQKPAACGRLWLVSMQYNESSFLGGTMTMI